MASNTNLENLTVDHIAVKNEIASLSLGSKGIALFDISDLLTRRKVLQLDIPTELFSGKTSCLRAREKDFK